MRATRIIARHAFVEAARRAAIAMTLFLLTALVVLVLLAVAFLLLGAPLALAQLASAPNTVVDFSPIANTLIGIAASFLSVIVPAIGWYYWRRLAKRWQLDDLEIEAKYRATLDEAIAKGIGLGAAKLGTLATPVSRIDVKSALVASVANTVVKSFPDTVKALGLDEGKVAEMVLSRLGIMAIQQNTGVVPPGLPAASPVVSTAPASTTDTKAGV